MFDFEKDYKLRNKRVELFPLHEKFFEALFLQSNKQEVWTFFTENGFGKENFQNYFENALKKRLDHEEYPFVIKDLNSNEVAGMTRLYALDDHLGNVKIGHTWIGEKFQGTGLNKNTKYVLFDFLFDQLNFERIGFGASADNVKSIQALKSVGCIQEGKLRGFLPNSKGKPRVDIVLLSLLKNEWNLSVKEMLKFKIESKEERD